TTQLGLVTRIELGLRRELDKTEPGRTFLTNAWEFLKRFEAGGVKLRDDGKTTTQELLPDQFAFSLAKTAERIVDATQAPNLFGATYDGILILIDEADNAPPGLQLGAMLKLLTERLQRHGCNKVILGLAGLPELRSALAKSHESAPRAFQEVVLGRLSHD